MIRNHTGSPETLDYSFVGTPMSLPLDLSDHLTGVSQSSTTSSWLPLGEIPNPMTSSQKKLPLERSPLTEGPSLSARINLTPVSPDASENVARRLFDASSEPSTAEKPVSERAPHVPESQKDEEGLFKTYTILFLGANTLVQAKESSQQRLKAMESILAIDPKYATGLAIKTLCLIIQGKIADFGEVFHGRSRPRLAATIGVISHALKAAEATLQEDPHHLMALIIQTGCLGLLAQYEQEGLLKPSSHSLIPEYEEPTSHCDAHQRTLDSAEKLLKMDPDNMTGKLMKIQALSYLGEREKALETLASALKSDPAHEVVLTLMAKFYYETDLRRALDAMSQALETNPRQFLAWEIHLHGLGKRGDKTPLRVALKAAAANLGGDPLLTEIEDQYLPESFEKKSSAFPV